MKRIYDWVRLTVIVAILLASCSQARGSPIDSEESSGNEDHEENLHVDQEQATSPEVDGHQEHHHPIAKSHGESCSDDGSFCDATLGLTCALETETCECDKSTDQVFSEGKCAERVVKEVPDNSVEEEEDQEEEEEEKSEAVVQHEEETSVTTEATKEDNSKVDIQQRQDSDNEEDDTSLEGSEEKPQVANGKCENVDCEASLGKFSKCNEESGECECSDVEGLNRPLIALATGKCAILRRINDPCSHHDECQATIAGHAWCHMDVVTGNRFCQCDMFHYFDESMQECLQFASDGILSSCKTDLQCTGFEKSITGHGLGPNARCAKDKGTCECKMGPGGQKAFLYENYCFYQMMPGESCKWDRECEVSFPQQAVACLDSQCMCRNGENITAVSCPSDPNDEVDIVGGSRRIDGSYDRGAIDSLKSAIGLDIPNFVFIMIIGAVLLLLVVIISVFIFKKRQRYSMVKTQEPTEEPTSPL